MRRFCSEPVNRRRILDDVVVFVAEVSGDDLRNQRFNLADDDPFDAWMHYKRARRHAGTETDHEDDRGLGCSNAGI